MSDCGPTPPKQARYMLRSSNGYEHCNAEYNEPAGRKRKRKGLQLMDLNDDCLLAIMECMKAVELVDIAETCKRAQTLAQYTFRLKHHRLDLTTIEGINLKLTMRLLRNFGRDISSLNIPRKKLSPEETDKSSKKILTLIGRHCHTNLTELSLTNIRITPTSIANVEKVFGSLKTLVLKKCSLRNCDLSPLNEHLEVLKLNHVDFVDSKGATSNNYKPLTTFLSTAQALKQLSIVKCTQLPCLIIRAIGRCTQLEELEIDLKMKANENAVKRNLVHLGSMKELKILKMRYYDINNAQLLSLAKGLKSLTELHIICCTPDVVTPGGCVEMLREADKLSCLYIDVPEFGFSINAYNEMVKIIKKRHEHIKLKLTFHSNEMEPMFELDNTVRVNNNKWLEVTEIRDPAIQLPLFFILFQ